MAYENLEQQLCPDLWVAGVDEVGRGPLAGDVVAAAVILDPEKPVDGLADSKKLSEKRRELLFDQILMNAKSVCIARASVAEIDQLNILQASLLAMRRAINGLEFPPQFALIDGNRLPTNLPCPAEPVVKGDGRVRAIAAASILAKVTRDREMAELDRQYPGYGLAGHKGYPTAQHLAALQQLGASPIHRRSFGPVREVINLKPSLEVQEPLL